MTRRAVILLSGGLDSATCLALAIRDGFRVHALTLDYGQRHRFELEAARRVAERLGAAEHRVIRLDAALFSGSALTDGGEVPRPRDLEEIGRTIPSTYVPARNLVFLSLATAWAESLGAGDLFIGVNAVDYSGYPDCRPDFIDAFARAATLGTRRGTQEREPVRVHTPLLRLSKTGIVRLGASLGVDFSLTHSCYDPAPDGRACGACDACRLRRKGFEDAGLADPAGAAET